MTAYSDTDKRGATMNEPIAMAALAVTAPDGSVSIVDTYTIGGREVTFAEMNAERQRRADNDLTAYAESSAAMDAARLAATTTEQEAP